MLNKSKEHKRMIKRYKQHGYLLANAENTERLGGDGGGKVKENKT